MRLYAGQTSAAIPGIATATNTAGYTTGSGTISSAQLQVNGENTTTAAVLSEGDVVSVLVTTSTSLTRRWVLSTVEYGLQILSKGAAGWSVKINDLIPGATSLTLGWDGATRTNTRNAIKAGPVVNVVPTISLDGETFTVANPGPWINEYSAGDIEFGYQWRRNGANIAGASGPDATSYTCVAADAGTTTTCAVTATDDNGPTTVVTNGIANPAAQVRLIPPCRATTGISRPLATPPHGLTSTSVQPMLIGIS